MFYIINKTHGVAYQDKYELLDEAIQTLNEYMHDDMVHDRDVEYAIKNEYGMTVFYSHTGTVKEIAEMLTAT